MPNSIKEGYCDVFTQYFVSPHLIQEDPLEEF